ncbi:MAG: DUF5615 family PIN-like protein [Chloroflexi bacterium]|nr:DUF5615 family PIN-like protein [Chloroflexota bacterium]
MRFKLDENLGTRTQRVFRARGHDVGTVREQGLGGSSDADLYSVCRSEGLCLVTLDLDFSDVSRFPPGENGTVVIRPPGNASLMLLNQLVEEFLKTLAHMSPEGALWIVEAGRVRVHEPQMDE